MTSDNNLCTIQKGPWNRGDNTNIFPENVTKKISIFKPKTNGPWVVVGYHRSPTDVTGRSTVSTQDDRPTRAVAGVSGLAEKRAVFDSHTGYDVCGPVRQSVWRRHAVREPRTRRTSTVVGRRSLRAERPVPPTAPRTRCRAAVGSSSWHASAAVALAGASAVAPPRFVLRRRGPGGCRSPLSASTVRFL